MFTYRKDSEASAQTASKRVDDVLALVAGCACDLARESARLALERADDRLHELFDEAIDSRVVGAVAFWLSVAGELARAFTGRVTESP